MKRYNQHNIKIWDSTMCFILSLLTSSYAQNPTQTLVQELTSKQSQVETSDLEDAEGNSNKSKQETSSKESKKQEKRRDPMRDVYSQKRTHLIQTNMRMRQLGVPDNFVDRFFFDSDDEGANPFKRPQIKANVIGFELALQHHPNVWTFYVEYLQSNVQPGYWDIIGEPEFDNLAGFGEYLSDKEKTTDDDHESGPWVRINNLGGWFFGTTYKYTIPLTPMHRDTWLGLMIGGGLGMGVVQGSVSYWVSPGLTDSSCLSEAPSYIRKDYCLPETFDSIPRIIPTLDLDLGLQLNFASRGHLRIEGGFHNMLYFGMVSGISF